MCQAGEVETPLDSKITITPLLIHRILGASRGVRSDSWKQLFALLRKVIGFIFIGSLINSKQVSIFYDMGQYGGYNKSYLTYLSGRNSYYPLYMAGYNITVLGVILAWHDMVKYNGVELSTFTSI